MASPLQQVVQQQTPPPPTIDPKAQQEGIVANMITEAPQKSTEDDYLRSVLAKSSLASKQLSDQMELMRSNLDRRTNIPFDPTLMQAAAGFLAPTKTGSFGESLGAAAGNAATQAEKDWLRTQETEKMKVELLQKQALLQQQMSGREFLTQQGTFGEPRGTAQPSGGATGATGSASATGVGTGVGSATGATQRPRGWVTERDISIAEAIGDPSTIKHIEEKYKRQQEQQKQLLDERKTQAAELTASNVKFDIAPQGLRGFVVKDVPSKDMDKYKKVIEQYHLDGDINKLYDEYRNLGWELPPELKKGRDGVWSALPSEQERQLSQKGSEGRILADIKAEEPMIAQILTKYSIANSLTNTAKDIQSIATSNKRAFDLLNEPGIADAFGRAFEKGIQAGTFGSFSLPVREVATYKLSTEDREALQTVYRKYAELVTHFRRVSRAPGEGATDAKEGALYAQLAGVPTDTAKAIRIAMEAIQTEATYNKEVGKAWNKFRKEDKTHSFSDFLYSDERANIDNQYNKRLEEMRQASVSAFAPVNSESTGSTPTAKPDISKGTSASGQIINAPTPVTPTPTSNAPVNRFRLEQERRKKGLQ